VRSAVVLGLSALLVAACSDCTKSQQTAGVTLGADVAVCILQHSTEAPGDIAKTCIGQDGPEAIALVTSILAEHKAAALRERLVDAGGGQ